MRFEELNLSAALLQAVAAEGYDKPTPIQEMAIPAALDGRDVLGCAQTGTGKTAAFALPILQKLSATGESRGRRRIRALVLTPTRELAAQVADNFVRYGAKTTLRTVVIFGGVSQVPQVEGLQRGADVVVATPGRLLDLIQQGHVELSGIEVFVLDEADRMLDMGFIHDIRRIVAHVPKKRQTLFFSATLPEDIRVLASDLLNDPLRVAVDPPASTVDLIEQACCFVEKGDKLNLLKHLLSVPELKRVLVFARTKHGSDKVVKLLKREGVGALAIHGNKSQGARTKALDGFKAGATRILVATDIAARGIDVEDIDLVVNYDLPHEPEVYVHRIGRTGRAGDKGTALSFCAQEERDDLAAIERLIGMHLVRVSDHPFRSPVPPPPPTLLKGRERPGSAAGVRGPGRPQARNQAPRPGGRGPEVDRKSAPGRGHRRGPKRPGVAPAGQR